MIASVPNLRSFAVAALALVGAGLIRAEGPASPFMSAQAANAPAAATNSQLEFRGVMGEGGAMMFRVVDTAHKVGMWVRLNELEKTMNLVVRKHDASGSRDVITVEQGGRTFNLELSESKVVSSGNASQMQMAPPPMSNVAPAVTNTVKVNPTPADEQARLDAVVAEVARRRALRDQSSAQNAQPVGAPQGVVPPPQPVQAPVQQIQPNGQPVPPQGAPNGRGPRGRTP